MSDYWGMKNFGRRRAVCSQGQNLEDAVPAAVESRRSADFSWELVEKDNLNALRSRRPLKFNRKRPAPTRIELLLSPTPNTSATGTKHVQNEKLSAYTVATPSELLSNAVDTELALCHAGFSLKTVQRLKYTIVLRLDQNILDVERDLGNLGMIVQPAPCIECGRNGTTCSFEDQDTLPHARCCTSCRDLGFVCRLSPRIGDDEASKFDVEQHSFSVGTPLPLAAKPLSVQVQDAQMQGAVSPSRAENLYPMPGSFPSISEASTSIDSNSDHVSSVGVSFPCAERADINTEAFGLETHHVVRTLDIIHAQQRLVCEKCEKHFRPKFVGPLEGWVCSACFPANHYPVSTQSLLDASALFVPEVPASSAPFLEARTGSSTNIPSARSATAHAHKSPSSEISFPPVSESLYSLWLQTQTVNDSDPPN